jgi:transposase-like protein
MQNIFYTNLAAQDFAVKKSTLFPEAPGKCPFGDCAAPVKLKKHGYYQRFFISKNFCGVIYIRRYICPVCGRTVSMLPMFCIQKFQYSGADIINMLYDFYQDGMSLTQLIKNLKSTFPYLERRHINYYRKRVIQNRQLIQYVLNLISPEFTLSSTIPEDREWVKRFLCKVKEMHPHVFLIDFSKTAGKSFMTSRNMIA